MSQLVSSFLFLLVINSAFPSVALAESHEADGDAIATPATPTWIDPAGLGGDLATKVPPTSPISALEELRAEAVKLMSDEIVSAGCIERICRRLRSIEARISTIHTEVLATKSEEDRARYLSGLSGKEQASLLKQIEEKLRDLQFAGRKLDLSVVKQMKQALEKSREEVERAYYPPILATLRKDYRERAEALRIALGSAQSSAEQKPLIAEQRELQEKQKAFDLLTTAEIEKARPRPGDQGFPTNDAKAREYIRANGQVIAQAAEQVASRFPADFRKGFLKNFEPVVTFGADGKVSIDFAPTEEYQKRQAEQRIALSTGYRGIADERGEQPFRLGELSVARSPKDSLGFFLGLSAAHVEEEPVSRLSDRSGVVSGGVEATNDEIAIATVLAGPGKIAAQGVARTFLNLGVRGTAKAAAQGAVVGGALDIALQAAESLDSFIAGRGWKGIDPIRTVQSAGTGLLLGPIAAANPGVIKVLGAVGVADGVGRAANGNYISAVVATGTSLLAFKPLKLSIGDAVAGDFHLSARRTSWGEIVIDRDAPSFRYLVAFARTIKNEGKDIGKIILNGDYIDAKSLAKLGVGGDAAVRAKLIAELRAYLLATTEKPIEVGLGNHDSIKDPVTGEYIGEPVALELKKLGIEVFAVNDTQVAQIPLTQRVAGRPVVIELSHKITNFGPNLAEVLSPDIIARVVPDVISTGNVQSGPNVAGKFSSDIHQPVFIESVNYNRSGTRFRFPYANTGSVSGPANTRLSFNGSPESFEVGTFLIVRATSKGTTRVELRTLTPGEGGGPIVSGRLNPGDVQSNSFGGQGRYPVRKVATEAEGLPQDSPYLDGPHFVPQLPESFRQQDARPRGR